MSIPENLLTALRDIPQQHEAGGSTIDQLRILRGAANRLGLTDAADFLRVVIDVADKKMQESGPQ